MNSYTEFELAEKFHRIRQTMLLFSGKNEITHSELCLMGIIAKSESPDGISVSEIAAKMEVSTPAVSRSLRSLGGRGLVERRVNAENRRSTMVVLTDKGRELLRRSGEEFMKMMKYVGTEMGEERLAEFNLLFREMMTHMTDYINKKEADSNDKNA